MTPGPRGFCLSPHSPLATPETAKTPLATTLESFRGVLQKRESVTEGIVGKLRTLVPRTVPAVKRRPILLDVSAEGITVHDLGEKAYEESVTSGKVRGIRGKMRAPVPYTPAPVPPANDRRCANSVVKAPIK